jgi:hypothetical protein
VFVSLKGEHMPEQTQQPAKQLDALEQSDQAASNLIHSVGNALRLCDVEAPSVGRALRDLFVADAKLYFEPVTHPGAFLRRLKNAP